MRIVVKLSHSPFAVIDHLLSWLPINKKDISSKYFYGVPFIHRNREATYFSILQIRLFKRRLLHILRLRRREKELHRDTNPMIPAIGNHSLQTILINFKDLNIWKKKCIHTTSMKRN